jgi:hypothetical protein
MNYKEQQAMVERLKTNKEAFYFWLSEEKDFAVENWKTMYVLCGTRWIEKGNDIFPSDSVYRLRKDFQLPAPAIEAPAGYRIVSMEDRKRCKFPVDCEVKYTCCGNGGWVSPEWKNWRNDEPDRHYAVPADYVFAEDRVKVPVKVEPVPVVLECPCCHAHFELKG